MNKVTMTFLCMYFMGLFPNHTARGQEQVGLHPVSDGDPTEGGSEGTVWSRMVGGPQGP